MENYKSIEELSKNKKLISDSFVNQKNDIIRVVDGVEIIQAKEETQEDIDFNYRVNLWRMRNK